MDKNTTITIEEIKKTLKTGDIIAFEGTGITSYFIRFFTFSKFSHIAIARRKENDLLIYEYPDAKRGITESNLIEKINQAHVKSVTILKSNREITPLQIEALDNDFSKRVSLKSSYSKLKAFESGFTKFMVVITFITLFTMGLLQAYMTFIQHDPLHPITTIITYIPIAILISLIYIKPKGIMKLTSKLKDFKLGSDYCSGYVTEADFLLGGELHKYAFLESNLTPKNIVDKAKTLGFEIATYKK